MVVLLLPLAQIDALAQEQLPQPSKPSPYHYALPDIDSAPQQPADPVQPVYPTHVNDSQQLPKKPVYQAQQPPQKPVDQAQVQYPPQPAYQAQQLYPQQPGYPSQPNPYYTQQQPAYPQQPGYQGQPYGQQPYPQQQYSQQAPAPQSYQDYADQGAYPDQNGPAQSPGFNQPPDQGFASQQLEQLVAPIALYPDTLVAQILAASTYPAQVIAADHWLQSMGPVSQDQVAAAANAQSTWDPSVKALTAFPQVLAMMDRDLQWTTDLGNAYYNQPQDVLATIQVLRQRAQSAGTLRSTPQEQVSDDQGYIQLAPANPQVVYVPSYNPWYAYGAPINPYPGFYLVDAFGHALAGIGAGLVFGAGIALGAFFHAAFGWLGWGLNWHGGGIYFNHAPYYSHSTSVAHWGGYRGGYHGGNGGSYAGGRSLPSRPTPLGHESAGNFAGNSRGESANGRASNPYENQRYAESQRNLESQRSARDAAGSAYRGIEGYGRVPSPSFAANRAENYAYARPAEPINRGAAGGYSSSYGRESSPSAYARPAEPMRQQFSAPQQQYGRTQAYANPGYNSGGYRGQQSFANERAYAAPSPASRGFRESEPRYESSGGSHFFGGGHSESYHAPKAPSYHAPKAPKMSGGGGHGHSGGGGKHR
jgi:hypothetical protein